VPETPHPSATTPEHGLLSGTFPELEVGGCVGVGAFASVYAARAGGVDAVLKVGPSPDQLAREARYLRHATRRGVPRPLGLRILRDGRGALLMTRARGAPLDAFSFETDRVAARCLRSLVDVLEGVHARGIVHADVKPGNVMFDPATEAVTLVDFGLARLEHATGPGDPAYTGGTLAYMPPEQLSGETLCVAADRYALGVMLYEVLCGRRPFPNDEPGRVLELKRRAHVMPPSSFGVSLGVGELLLALLDPRPASRPGFRAIRKGLDAILRRRCSRHFEPFAVDPSETTERLGGR